MTSQMLKCGTCLLSRGFHSPPLYLGDRGSSSKSKRESLLLSEAKGKNLYIEIWLEELDLTWEVCLFLEEMNCCLDLVDRSYLQVMCTVLNPHITLRMGFTICICWSLFVLYNV